MPDLGGKRLEVRREENESVGIKGSCMQ